MENDSLPIISIITVTLNSVKLLETTINSVAAQSYPLIEFIIIDGGSTDGTLSLIKDNETQISTYISETDNGIYDAMNKGLVIASGKYVHFLNAGEYFCHDSSLSDIISSAKKDSDIIYGDILLLDDERGIRRHHKSMELSIENLKRYGTGVLCHQAILVKKEIANQYDCKYKYKAELNWYFDILENNSNISIHQYKKPFVAYSLGGTGYKNFFHNRLEWYYLLYFRFGYKSILNLPFLKFIVNDFSNRYSLIRRIADMNKSVLRSIKFIR